jgi:hypothetical protein
MFIFFVFFILDSIASFGMIHIPFANYYYPSDIKIVRRTIEMQKEASIYSVENNFNFPQSGHIYLNEVVKIIDSTDNELSLVEIENKNYILNEKMCNLYYVKNKDLISLDSINDNLKKYIPILSDNKNIYTFGGTLLLNTVNEKSYFLSDIFNKNSSIKYWTRDNTIKYHGGIDCSGLINLILNMVKIPCPMRTSSLQLKYFKKIPKNIILKENETIKDGDMLAWNGHIVILFPSINKIIHSGGYTNYNGSLAILHLSDFCNFHTFKELYENYSSNQPLKLLNKNKEEYKIIKEYYLLTLEN